MSQSPSSLAGFPKTRSRRAALLGLGSAAMLARLHGCSRSLDIAEFEVDDYTTGTIRPHISVDRQVTRRN